MTSAQDIDNKSMYEKIKVLSNPARFKIYELCSKKGRTIKELSSSIGIAYNKCSDYVRMMEKAGIVMRDKEGKETRVKSSYADLL